MTQVTIFDAHAMQQFCFALLNRKTMEKNKPSVIIKCLKLYAFGATTLLKLTQNSTV